MAAEQNSRVAPWPSATSAWFAVMVLALAYGLSYLDRMTLTFLVQPMRRDLEFSDTQISLLMGLSFALFYAAAGLPLSRIADRANRRTLVIGGIAMWSVMTALCSVAHSFPVFFIARVGVGVGEACLGPAAISLIADFFPQQRRALATGIYVAGGTVGIAAAYLVGGFAVEAWGELPSVVLPIVGEFFPWQATFLAIATPGIVPIVLLMLIREPARRGTSELVGECALAQPGVMKFIAKRWQAYLPVLAAPTLLGVAHFATTSWAPTLIIRGFDWSPRHTGEVFATLGLTFGVLGPLLGGALAQLLMMRGRSDQLMNALLVMIALTIPAYVLAPLSPRPEVAIGLCFLGSMLVNATLTLPQIVIQNMAPNELRGQLIAVLLFLINFVGLGLGPTIVAALTDLHFANPARIGWSMAITSAVFAPLALAVALFGRHHYRNEANRAASEWRDSSGNEATVSTGVGSLRARSPAA